MYGYVVVNKPELKFREFDEYRSYYCGLCDALGSGYGTAAKTTLSYDFTFLVILLTGLYEPEITECNKRCAVHPLKKHTFRRSEITDYVADMGIILAYYKCIDDWNDDRSIKGKLGGLHFKKSVEEIEKRCPDKAEAVRRQMERLAAYEAAGGTDIDEVSQTFGNIMAEVFAMKHDEWESSLRKIGFYLGKFIYILDAYDDLEADIKKNRYNVLKNYADRDDFETFVLGILNGVMAQCARYFEYLPIVQDAGILKNIIYSGVWTRYEQVKKRRLGEK